jgi:hypothetical protein
MAGVVLSVPAGGPGGGDQPPPPPPHTRLAAGRGAQMAQKARRSSAGALLNISPPTTPRAYLCCSVMSVEGPPVPAGSQFLGLTPAPV